MTTIGRYMTAHPHTVDSRETVDGARALMLRLGVRHLPVVDGASLVGLLSERDVAFADRAGAGKVLLCDLVSSDTRVVEEDASLSDVARIMATERIGSLGVTRNGLLVGIFTTVDACRALVDALGA